MDSLTRELIAYIRVLCDGAESVDWESRETDVAAARRLVDGITDADDRGPYCPDDQKMRDAVTMKD